MIEIKFLAEDIEGIRDFGILLLQNNIMYRMRKEGRFVIFEISISKYGYIACIRIGRNLDQELYSKFSLQFEKFKEPFEFKAFALKIY